MILSQPPNGPWVITLENVATEEQCNHIIQLGANRGYERSSDVGRKKFDGTFDTKILDTRTSHNTWCLDECHVDETNQNVLRNVENITGIPETNSEYWQLLQYEETQRYAVNRGFRSGILL
jgi:prolyl 4-hydroxylase